MSNSSFLEAVTIIISGLKVVAPQILRIEATEVCELLGEISLKTIEIRQALRNSDIERAILLQERIKIVSSRVTEILNQHPNIVIMSTE
jgi:hypothetical protein